MSAPKDKRTKEYKEWKANQPTKVKLGLGDAIESITKATGIKKVVDALTDDCGCEARKKYLNQFKLPTRAKAKRCFTIEQRKQFADYMTRRTLKGWSREDIIMLIDLFENEPPVPTSTRDWEEEKELIALYISAKNYAERHY